MCGSADGHPFVEYDDRDVARIVELPPTTALAKPTANVMLPQQASIQPMQPIKEDVEVEGERLDNLTPCFWLLESRWRRWSLLLRLELRLHALSVVLHIEYSTEGAVRWHALSCTIAFASPCVGSPPLLRLGLKYMRKAILTADARRVVCDARYHFFLWRDAIHIHILVIVNRIHIHVHIRALILILHGGQRSLHLYLSPQSFCGSRLYLRPLAVPAISSTLNMNSALIARSI